METPKVLGPDESLRLFNTMSHEQQLAVMMARTRLARCISCPREWPLAHKLGVADLCSGGIDQPTASDYGTARALIAEMEQPASRLDYRPTLSGEVPSTVEELMDPRSA